MVSIGQKLSLQQSQLSLQKKTAQTENLTENATVANGTSINVSKDANLLTLNQIDTGSLLANNGIKINRPDGDKSSQEVNTNYYDFGNDYNDYYDYLNSDKLCEGDRVKFDGRDGQVIASEKGLVIMFENGSVDAPGGPFFPPIDYSNY